MPSLDGAEIMFGLWFYKDAAPTALDGSKTRADGAHPQTGRICRALRTPHSEFRIGNGLFSCIHFGMAKLKAPVTAERKFEAVVKSAQDAAMLILVY
jgi:hypothetical protein